MSMRTPLLDSHIIITPIQTTHTNQHTLQTRLQRRPALLLSPHHLVRHRHLHQRSHHHCRRLHQPTPRTPIPQRQPTRNPILLALARVSGSVVRKALCQVKWTRSSGVKVKLKAKAKVKQRLVSMDMDMDGVDTGSENERNENQE